MALSTTITRALYTGNGTNTTFAIPGTIIESDSAEVMVYELALDGTVTLLVEGALQDYTLTGASPPSTPFDTDVEMNSAPANGVKILVIRILAITQGIHVNSNSEIIAATTQERGYDRLTAICQQLQEQINRAVKLNITSNDTDIEIETPELDYVLVGDANGNIVNGLKTETIQAAIDAAISAAAEAAAAALSAAQAAASAAAAAVSAADALESENNAETAETNAELAETNAETAQAAAEAAQAAAEAAVALLDFPAPANTVMAGPESGPDDNPTMRALVGADLPNPSSTTKGGVKSLAAASNKFLTSIGTDGTPTQAQPSFSDLVGTTDSTKISDFTEASQDAVGAMVDTTLVYTDATPLLSRAALTGDVTAAGGSNATTLATVNANVGTFGSGSQVSVFTVNAKGLITAASNATITAAGDVTGPASATDNAIPKYDGTTGKKIQDTGVLISSGNKVLGISAAGDSPSYSFVTDPDTGMYSDTANVLGFAAGGSNKVEISASLVDVVIPLRVGPEADETAITATADGTGTALVLDALNGSSVPLDIRLDGSTTVIVDTTGQVGIGTGTVANGHLNLGAGTTAQAPLNIAQGTLVTSPWAGNVETDSLDLYYTNSGGVRQNIALGGHTSMGIKFVYNSAGAVDLTVASFDLFADIPLANGTTVKTFHTSIAITCNLAASGANGLDTGAEAASKFYYLWGIGKEDGTLATLFSLSSTAPTMPTDYVYKRLLWGVANDASSNILNFVHLKDGTCYYTTAQANSVRGAIILSGGTSTSYAAVSMAVYAPDIVGAHINLEINATNASSTNSVFTLSEDSSGTVLLQSGRTIGTTGAVMNSEHWTRGIRIVSAAATSLYYKWATNSGSQTANIYIQDWNIGGPTWH